MINYILQNLKKNLRKFIVMLIMLIIGTTVVLFTLEIVNNLIHEMSIRSSDVVAQDDLESMITLLTSCVVLLISFVVFIIDNTYSVVLFGRQNEFVLLNRLGYYKRRIKRMLEGEVIIISTISCIIGIVLSKILSSICMSKFDLMAQLPLPTLWYLCYYAALILGMIIIVHKDFKKITIDMGENVKYIVNEKREKKSFILMIIGAILILFALFATDGILEPLVHENTDLCKKVIFIVGIGLIIDEVIIIVMKVLLWLSLKMQWNVLYISITQNLYNYKKVKSIISSIVIAVAFFIGFQGLYHSLRETTKKYVNESVNYEKMIIFNQKDLLEEEKAIEVLENLKDVDTRYSLALNYVLIDDEEHTLTLSGIDESYYSMQRFYVEEGSDIDSIYEENGTVQVMFSSKAAIKNDYVIGDKLTQYKLDDKNLEFQISALYDPINLKQAFTSRKELSKYLWGEENVYNAIYLNGYSDKAIDSLMQYYKGVSYDIYNMKEFAQDCVDQATNGTEMIEIILYVSMFFVTSLVINLFVLSYGDRKKQYAQLQILGMRKEVILGSMLVESGMIYILGAVIGFIIAIPSIDCMLILVKSELVFDTVRSIPYLLVIGILAICFSCLMLFTYIIGVNSLKQDIKDKIGEH